MEENSNAKLSPEDDSSKFTTTSDDDNLDDTKEKKGFWTDRKLIIAGVVGFIIVALAICIPIGIIYGSKDDDSSDPSYHPYSATSSLSPTSANNTYIPVNPDENMGCPWIWTQNKQKLYCGGNGKCKNTTSECQCNPGWGGENCNCQVSAGNLVCSGNGYCNGGGVCECTDGWTGTLCEIPLCPMHNNAVCSGNGFCASKSTNTTSSSKPYCKCTPGKDNEEIYFGNDCSCDKRNYPNFNTKYGKCSKGVVTCNQGYIGNSCQAVNSGECPRFNQKICNGQGECDVQTGKCTCNPGYLDVDCSVPDCSALVPDYYATNAYGVRQPPCYGNGNCVGPNKCECYKGYGGADCSCPSSNANECSDLGICRAGACLCREGHYGKDCTSTEAFNPILAYEFALYSWAASHGNEYQHWIKNKTCFHKKESYCIEPNAYALVKNEILTESFVEKRIENSLYSSGAVIIINPTKKRIVLVPQYGTKDSLSNVAEFFYPGTKQYKNIAGAKVQILLYDLYHNMANDIRSALSDAMKNPLYKDYTLHVTGFSSGAVVATYAILDLLDNGMQVKTPFYNFESLRPGNYLFSSFFEDKVKGAFRITHEKDMFVLYPPRSLGYYHVGEEAYLYNQDWYSLWRMCGNMGESPQPFCSASQSLLLMNTKAHFNTIFNMPVCAGNKEADYTCPSTALPPQNKNSHAPCVPCSGHGKCDSKTGKCLCDEGWARYSPDCSQATCKKTSVGLSSMVCYGHGKCTGYEQCTCNLGYGSDCLCPSADISQECTKNGKCGGNGEVVYCVCNAGTWGPGCSVGTTSATLTKPYDGYLAEANLLLAMYSNMSTLAIQSWQCGAPYADLCDKYWPKISDFKVLGVHETLLQSMCFTGSSKKLQKIFVVCRFANQFLNYVESAAAFLFAYDDEKAPGALVHIGFKSMFSKKLQDAVLHDVKALKSNGDKASYGIVTTGYGVGGCLAMFAALHLTENGVKVELVETFGSLRLGNDVFAKYYWSKLPNTHRITFQDDITPHLIPRAAGYHHVPNEMWANYDVTGKTAMTYCIPSGEDPDCSLSVPFWKLLWTNPRKMLIDLPLCDKHVTSDCPVTGCQICSGKGSCKNKKCQCVNGWGGYDCSTPLCDSGCNVDNLQGACVDGNVCRCALGWGGTDNCECPSVVATKACSGKGKCSNAQCSCDSGYTGRACEFSTPKTPFNQTQSVLMLKLSILATEPLDKIKIWQCEMCQDNSIISSGITYIDSAVDSSTKSQTVVLVSTGLKSIFILTAWGDSFMSFIQKLDAALIPWTYNYAEYPQIASVRVHKGIYGAYMNTQSKIIRATMTAVQKQLPDYEIAVAGYGLGGALATIAAIDLGIFGIKFGSMPSYFYNIPRVGNYQFVNLFKYFVPNSFRVVQNNDMTSRSPPRFMGYWHIPVEMFIKPVPSKDNLGGYQIYYCNESGEDKQCSLGIGWWKLRGKEPTDLIPILADARFAPV
eukprot:Nk52_evm65s270 gene=Nk52_evmTU65s270